MISILFSYSLDIIITLNDIIICKYFAYNLSCTLCSLCYAYNCVDNCADEYFLLFIKFTCIFLPWKNCVIDHSVI